MEIPSIVFKISYLLLIILTIIIRHPHQKRNKENRVTQDRKTPTEMVLLVITSLGMMGLPLIYILTPWLSFADYTLPFFAEVAGVALAALAIWLFYRSHEDLGRNWSVSLEIREQHTLVDQGVYRHIRHPMYTSIWVWCIFQALFLQNYIAGLSGLVGFGILYFIRVYKEEAMMLETFGDQYRNYKNRTKRIIPFVW